MTARAWPVHPGVPGAGHVTVGGAWHPGSIDGCIKCDPPEHAPAARAQRAQRAAAERTGGEGDQDATASQRQILCSCRSGYANNPLLHNNQVRTSGRCRCACHHR
jgi:hypothetical protein